MGHIVSFSWLGTVPASKSLFNRLLVCQSYFPDLKIEGRTEADDVVLMKTAVENINNNVRELDCGYAGTVLRFLALRTSRLGGEWFLKGEPELLSRPHDGLFQILGQLSVDWQMETDGLWMHSEGWRIQGDGLHVSMKQSSQFLSGVLLNGWQLEKDLFVAINSRQQSLGYYEMTLNLVRRLGMEVIDDGKELVIRAGARCEVEEVAVEPDMSSAFSLAAVAAVSGDATFQNFPNPSLQPDAGFVEILENMGVIIQRESTGLKVHSSGFLKAVTQDLSDCPDLFPSLAVLCALADGESHLYGAPHLKFKESDRIAKVAELIQPLGRKVEVLDDGIKISGNPRALSEVSPWTFDPSHDHRMAMAAAVLKKAGCSVEILNRQVVSKSFPDFWSAIGEVS